MASGFFLELENIVLDCVAGIAGSPLPQTATTATAEHPAITAAAEVAHDAGSVLASVFPTSELLAQFALPVMKAYVQAHASLTPVPAAQVPAAIVAAQGATGATGP